MIDTIEIREPSTCSQTMVDLSKPVNCALNTISTDDTARLSSIDSSTTISSTCTYTNFALSVEDGQHVTAFSDEYEICPTILGTGAYGCVRECIHRATGERYAVKTIDKSTADFDRREIELLRSIDHPNVMKMVDCYEDSDFVNIVTERYTGGELYDEIEERTTDYGCVLEDQAVTIIKSLLEAVQYLHENDIVHRDIKPENILFEDEGSSIKLIDFGLSRKHGIDDEPMSSQVGSSYYQSPDLLHGKYDRSCDIWSVGVIAYILLTGYPPFGGETNDEIRDSILKGEYTFENEIWGSLSKTSMNFVCKLLTTDSTRISTAAEALQHPWIVNL